MKIYTLYWKMVNFLDGHFLTIFVNQGAFSTFCYFASHTRKTAVGVIGSILIVFY